MKLIHNSILILCLGLFTHSSAITPKETVMINGVKATVWASSELKSKTPGRYSPKNLFDNDPATAWVEGVEGNGIDEWVTIKFETPLECDAISFDPGYKKSFALMRANALPDTIGVIINNVNKDVVFRYNKEYGSENTHIYLKDDSLNFQTNYHFLLAQRVHVNTLRIRIKSAINGTNYKDLAISGIHFETSSNSFINNLTYLRSYKLLKTGLKNQLSPEDAKKAIYSRIGKGGKFSYGVMLKYPYSEEGELQEFYNEWNSALCNTLLTSVPLDDRRYIVLGGSEKFFDATIEGEFFNALPIFEVKDNIESMYETLFKHIDGKEPGNMNLFKRYK